MFGRNRAPAFAFALLTACGRLDVSRAPAPSATPSPPTVTSVTPEPLPVATAELTPWPALVRDEQWDAAFRALEALGEPERSRPEVRYVRARVALSRHDGAAALPLLEGLESVLPLLAADVGRHRAEAMSIAGPFVDAAEWYGARASAASQLDAARAFEKAGDSRRARAAADRVVASEKKTRTQEAEARALRARSASPLGEGERADVRWLSTQGADLPAAGDAVGWLAKVDPGHPLTASELIVRARVLSEAGRTDDALRAIESVASAPGGDALPRIERLRARAMTLYRARGRYGEASRALSECAFSGGPNAAEDGFHAARALSRADRDEEAIRAYEEVERRYPKTKWAEQASFFVPYLRMLHGEWRACAHGFATYVRIHAAGENLRDARSDGALCTLLDGDAKGARVEFEHLVEDEPDPTASARLANLAALAAFRDGDRAHAILRWSDVVRSRPLTWPALVAVARLSELRAAVPSLIATADGPAAAVAPLVVSLPPPSDLLHQLGLEQDAETALHEREAVVTSGAGGRAPEALCVAYGQLSRARRRFQFAQSLPSALFAASPTDATRWAWDCAFPEPYADAVKSAEEHERLPRGILWAVMRQESGFDPDAVSPARAVGLMQLMPDTARPLAAELDLPRDDARLTSPSYSIRVGARALRRLLDQFHGSVPLALAAYNGGAESVERWTSRAPGMQLDTFVERIPFKETRDYVVRVMGNVAHYAYLSSGEQGVPRVPLAM